VDAEIRLMGRDGTNIGFHPISIRYLLESDQLVIDIAGIDHTLLLSLGELELSKLTKATMDGKIALHKARDRVKRDRSPA
jgi:hypothetical protein